MSVRAREDIWKCLGAIILLSSFISLGCKSIHPSSPSKKIDPADPQCYHNGDLSPAKRRQIYPFDRAASVEVISFKGVYGYDFGTIDGEEEEEVVLPDTFERVVLTDSQIDSFTDILYNFNYAKTTVAFIENLSSYFPRQAILFKDSLGQTIESIEICFKSSQVKSTLPKYSYGDFCEGKYALLKDFFVSLGITYFGKE